MTNLMGLAEAGILLVGILVGYYLGKKTIIIHPGGNWTIENPHEKVEPKEPFDLTNELDYIGDEVLKEEDQGKR